MEYLNSSDANRLSLNDFLLLRGDLVVNHPLNESIIGREKNLFVALELYSCFVYDFMGYVGSLFVRLTESKLKEAIYENLTDEMGLSAGGVCDWRGQHGELYRSFIKSLRRTMRYADSGLMLQYESLELESKDISKRFYETHFEILEEGDDLQSFAAFTAIECWVCDLYTLWKSLLLKIEGVDGVVDMRTIDLHCVCDVEHSAKLDALLQELHESAFDAPHRIRKGILRGSLASERLFSDIRKRLL